MTNVGTYALDSQNTTLKSGSSTKVCTLSLPAGTYFLCAQGNIQGNSEGRRLLNILLGTEYNSVMIAEITENAPTVGDCYLNVSAIQKSDEAFNVTSWMLQNSGSDLTGGVTLKAVRIK